MDRRKELVLPEFNRLCLAAQRILDYGVKGGSREPGVGSYYNQMSVDGPESGDRGAGQKVGHSVPFFKKGCR